MFKRKYPVVRQYDQIDCAPACLLSILRYYGGDDSLVHIRELCQTNRSGSNMLSLVQAAEKLGFAARGVRGEYKDLVLQQMPCIAHMVLEDGLQHFVVIYRIIEDSLLVADPGRGLHKITKEEFLRLWQLKTVVLLQPQSSIFKGSHPRWYNWIFSYTKVEKNRIYQALFLGIVYTLLGLLTAVFIQLLIDRLMPQGHFFNIAMTAMLLLIALLIRSVAGYFKQRFSIELNKRISIQINKTFISHLFKLPKTFFDSRKTGDVTARIHDAIRIQQAVLQLSGTTIIDLLILITSLAFIFLFSPILGLTTVLTVPLYGLSLWLSSRKLQDRQQQVMQNFSRVESNYIDSIRGIDEIFNFRSASFFSEINQVLFLKYQQSIEKLGITSSKLALLAELCSAVIISSVIIVSASLVLNDKLLLGQMMAVYSLLATMFPSVNRLVDVNISLQGASVASQRLLDMLLLKKEMSKARRPFMLKNSLAVEDASYSWPGAAHLLKKITLTLKKGQLTALWGKSGSGKSTLTQLILRKYACDAGRILVDGQPADAFDLYDYRRDIGVVSQDIQIFNTSLVNNILCGRVAPTIEFCRQKIEALGFTFFLERFESDLLTNLGEDRRKLSGGEKQILGLLRALWDQPQILIIDEGLSAIDIELEARIDAIIHSYANQQAVLLISHNLRTILKAEQIYILEQGCIIENDPAKKLLAQKGYFYRLWQMYHDNNGRKIEIA